jgi:Dyp-type peroxidase family
MAAAQLAPVTPLQPSSTPARPPPTAPTRQFAGLVFARVDRDKLETLRALLARIGEETTNTMRGAAPEQPIIPFTEFETIHYARFVLLEDYRDLAPHLAFSTNYDGPPGEDSVSEGRALKLHLEELVRHGASGLERVFSCCAGFRAGHLLDFMRKSQRPASTFYVGSSGRSRNQILWEAELRRQVDLILDHTTFTDESPANVRDAVRTELRAKYTEIPSFPAQPDRTPQVARALRILITIALAVAALLSVGIGVLLSRWGLSGYLAVPALILLLGVGAGAAALRFRHLELSDPQFQPQFSLATVASFRKASQDENEFLQNQLTHLVPIKPGPLRWLLIRAVFAALDILARNQYNHGKLGGIPSIHFARWVLIPKRGVLFFSNFDSSWQSYLGDFIDQASSGLTAVWSNTVDYPRTTWLLTAGSRDASRFLAWTRAHQHPTQVWYSAYPGLSIVNINANTEIRRGLAESGSMDAKTWLFHLRGVDRLDADEVYANTREQAPLRMQDIQGIVLWGYGHMPEARYLMFRVKQSGAKLRAFIAGLPVTSAEGERDERPREPLLNVAFSYAGLLELGVEPELCERFSTAFVQGSHDPYRALVNGDIGADAPANWVWGSEQNPVHVLLLVYAETKSSVQLHADNFTQQALAAGLELVQSLEGTTLPGRKEHFGFRDGIAQPSVKGSGRGEIEGNSIAAGEFLLGHRDGYGNVSHSPESSAGFAFGRNGSYLVFRQLEQDVDAFWRYCASQNKDAVAFASKLVGRWPSGAPLVRHPHEQPPDDQFADEDTFTYLSNEDDNDRYGARCPFGAHIRRANPRDWQLGADPDESLELSNLHRILRRARPYGPPLDETMSADKLIAHALADSALGSAAPRRGLQFLCFNTSIDRQFEFVQQQWCNNPKFAGQNSDVDALIGARPPLKAIGIDPAAFTIQSDVGEELERRALNLQRFVRLVGSAYFFMPSLPAIRLFARDISTPSAAGELEQVPPDEQLHIDSLIDHLREKMKRDYGNEPVLRDAHPKMHGCVRALFKVEPGLDPALAVGIFSKPSTYQTWVRFSNASGTVSPDRAADLRGVALKLIDVAGTKLLDGAEDAQTHDFLLVSADSFMARDVAQFDGLVSAMCTGKGAFLKFLLKNPSVALKLYSSFQRHTNPLTIQYFSIVPYLLGSRAVKYTLKPQHPGDSAVPANAGPDYLRDALKRDLARGSVSFDFMVQLQTRPKRMPIEDASVAWSSRNAPFQKVATLEILRQEFDTASQREFGENLSFNPWRCLPEHRPLGGLSRARRQVYRALSGFRHDRNAAAQEEPGKFEP